MATKNSYSHARENLASLWDEVENSREAAIIQRRGHEDMALVPADELATLRETEAMPEEAAFAIEQKYGMQVMSSQDAAEGPRAFLEKRKAVFKGK